MAKYHYLYKITNKITQEYYYGVHSTDNLKDYYFGSGAALKDNIRKYGLENFEKETLEFFPSRKDMMNEERRIVNKELLKDPKCLNMILGGGELKGSIGRKCVMDDHGVYRMVDKNNDSYTPFFIGRICINKDGKMKYIKPYELDLYVKQGWSKGTIYKSPGKDKIWIMRGEERKQIDESRLSEFEKGGWERGFAGVNKRVWVNKNDSSIQILKEDLQKYLDEGWKRGFGKKTVNGRITVVKGSNKKYILREDLQKYLDEGWVRGDTISNAVWVNKEGKNSRVRKENIQKYINDGWKIGRYGGSKPTRKVYIYDLDGNLLKEFNKVREANKEGYNNIHKYADSDKVYMKNYIVSYYKK